MANTSSGISYKISTRVLKMHTTRYGMPNPDFITRCCCKEYTSSVLRSIHLQEVDQPREEGESGVKCTASVWRVTPALIVDDQDCCKKCHDGNMNAWRCWTDCSRSPFLTSQNVTILSVVTPQNVNPFSRNVVGYLSVPACKLCTNVWRTMPESKL